MVAAPLCSGITTEIRDCDAGRDAIRHS
jgi:hypothetical protein